MKKNKSNKKERMICEIVYIDEYSRNIIERQCITNVSYELAEKIYEKERKEMNETINFYKRNYEKERKDKEIYEKILEKVILLLLNELEIKDLVFWKIFKKRNIENKFNKKMKKLLHL